MAKTWVTGGLWYYRVAGSRLMHKRPGPACCENARQVWHQGDKVHWDNAERGLHDSSLINSRRNVALSQASCIPWTAQNCYPCLGHTVTYVLAMFCHLCLGHGPSRTTQRYRDAADIELWKVLLRRNMRRAVVYRGPRLGAFIDLLHRFA